MKKKSKTKKYYLVDVVISDGDHEHRDYAVVKAVSEDRAEARVKKVVDAENDLFDNLNEYGDDDSAVQDVSWFGYGDGTTIMHIDRVREINKTQAKVLKDLLSLEAWD
jgi:hypothetical protein